MSSDGLMRGSLESREDLLKYVEEMRKVVSSAEGAVLISSSATL